MCLLREPYGRKKNACLETYRQHNNALVTSALLRVRGFVYKKPVNEINEKDKDIYEGKGISKKLVSTTHVLRFL